MEKEGTRLLRECLGSVTHCPPPAGSFLGLRTVEIDTSLTEQLSADLASLFLEALRSSTYGHRDASSPNRWRAPLVDISAHDRHRRPTLISSSSKTGVSLGARFLALRQRRYERSPPPARLKSSSLDSDKSQDAPLRVSNRIHTSASGGDMAKKRAARYPGHKSGKARCATTVPATEHVQVFGRTRPSHSGTYPIHGEPERDTHFWPLPPPTGAAPFHLDRRFLPVTTKRLSARRSSPFNGTMGGIKNGIDNADFS